MEWQNVGTYNINDLWQFSFALTAKTFRVSHLLLGISNFRPTAIISLCSATKNEFNSIETYQPQALKYYLESEIIQFTNIPKNWEYKLGVKQVILSAKASIVDWKIQIDMPSYSLDDPTPVNQLASSTKTVTSVAVAATPTKILSANPLRKGVLFVSPDKVKTVYLDTDNVVSNLSAIESLTPSRPQCVPAIDWTGEWWGAASSGSVTITVEEYT